MPAKRVNRKPGYGENLIGAWVLIIIVAAAMVMLHLSGAAAVIIGTALVLGLAVAGSRKR
jgi:hypothetical protein